jgi:CRP/FNR family transcriptional regulator, cyclic AMP receptor protein
MRSAEKIGFLENVPLFSGVSQQDLIYVAGIVKEIIYPAGTTVILEEDIGDYMFIVVEGEVMVHCRSIQLAKLGPHDFFGEMSILDREPRSASVTTLTDCVMLRIDESEFWELLIAHNSLAVSMVRVLARRLREMLSISKPYTPKV